MQATLKASHWEVRTWCGKIPLGKTLCVALEGLDHALELTSRQLNGALDEARRDPAGSASMDWRIFESGSEPWTISRSGSRVPRLQVGTSRAAMISL
jgi:hypothetical protein